MLQSSYDVDQVHSILRAEMSLKMTYSFGGVGGDLRFSDQIGKFKPLSISYNEQIPPGMSR